MFDASVEDSIGLVYGSDLKSHLLREAVFVVADALALNECAKAIADDDAKRVAKWIESGELRRPTRDEVITWSEDKERCWLAAVVKPYVLVQLPKEGASPGKRTMLLQ